MMEETYVLVMRELKKWLGRRGTFLVSLVTPLAWLALFGKSLNFVNMFSGGLTTSQFVNPQLVKQYIDQTLIRLFGTTDYFSYLTTGMFVVFAFFQSVFGGVNIVFEKRLGSMNRLRLTPAPRASIFLAKMIATLIRIFFYETVLLVIALALGFNPKWSVTGFLASGAAIAIMAAGFVSVFEGIGFNVDNQEIMFSIVNLINLPLMFASPVLFPLRQMPWWLQDIARFNPLTYTVDIVRYNLLGLSTVNYYEAWGILLGFTAVFVAAGLAASLRVLENY
ncbi:MAG: ABC transporter permease [Acidilobus sp.]